MDRIFVDQASKWPMPFSLIEAVICRCEIAMEIKPDHSHKPENEQSLEWACLQNKQEDENGKEWRERIFFKERDDVFIWKDISV